MAKKAKVETPVYSQEQLASINGYGDEFISLDSFVEKVRQTPDVYMGPIGNEGFETMIREDVQNSIDEAGRKDSPCDTIIVSFDQRSKALIVEDNGRGIPFGKIIDAVTKDHTSTNYVKKKGQYTAGKNGMGLKICNAMSDKMVVESSILGVTHRVEFDDGYVWDKGEVEVKSNKYQGLVTMFIPSEAQLGTLTTTWQDVHKLMHILMPLSKIGTTMIFNAIDDKGNEHYDKMINQEGVITLLRERTEVPLINPVQIYEDTGEMRVNIMFTYDTGEFLGENIISFNNFCPTIGGKHVDGFKLGLCNYFRKYMNDIYLSGSKTKTTVIGEDILYGLRAVVNTDMLKPLYHGQSKNILSNEEMKSFSSTVTYNALDQWSKTNPRDMQILCKFFKEIAEARIKTDTAKIKVTNSFKKNAVGNINLPNKYKQPIKQKVEFIIVEGDSAAGTADDARDANYQGIYGIRGKFPNAANTTKWPIQKIMTNPEAAGIVSILDDGRGDNYQRPGHPYDVSKCPYQKVIIMTDADEDGVGHIRPLLYKFFLIYMPGLILDGRLYAAMPPLYGAKVGNKIIYFSSDLELSKYLQKEFLKKNIIQDVRGKKLSQLELGALILKNMKYCDIMNSLRRTVAVDPDILELILNNYKNGYKGIKKVLEEKYRFINVEKKSGVIIVDGTLGNKTQTIAIDDRLIGFCGEAIEYLANSEEVYVVNGQPMGLYNTMNTINKYRPNNIKRFKGLGEMDADELADSTLSPTGHRNLIRYTIDDIKKELHQIRAVESDFSVLLKSIRSK